MPLVPAGRKSPTSMVMTRIGGHDYPMRSVQSCKTCMSPDRLNIENMMLQGRSYKGIEQWLEGQEAGSLGHPDARGISAHFNLGHMPLPAAAQRRLIERRAEQVGRQLEEGVEDLTDYVTVNQMIVQRGFERLQSGDIEPDVGDTISAIRSLHTIEQSIEGGIDQQTWATAMTMMMNEARSRMTPEMWRDFGRSLTSSPVLRQMLEAGSTVDGEVVPNS